MTRRCGWAPLLALLLAVPWASALDLAILPPAESPELEAAIQRVAREIGVGVSSLQPEQLIDPQQFNPDTYAMVILIGGEKFPDSVRGEGDASLAIEQFVAAGGSLLAAADGVVLSRPQRWGGAEWYGISAPVRRVNLQSRLGLLDAGQSLEVPVPDDAEFVSGPTSPLASRLPERFPAPALRPYRPIPSNQEAAVLFTPVATLVDAQGGTYGAGVAEMRREAEGGSVYYCWAPLLTADVGREILLGVLRLHADRRLTPEARQRRSDLLSQIDQLQKLHGEAYAIVPQDLDSPDLDAILEMLREQAHALVRYREAAQVGNLDFVADGLTRLREVLAELPPRVGRAVDSAVIDAVANPGQGAALPLADPLLSSGRTEAEPWAGPSLAAVGSTTRLPSPAPPAPFGPPNPDLRQVAVAPVQPEAPVTTTDAVPDAGPAQPATGTTTPEVAVSGSPADATPAVPPVEPREPAAAARPFPDVANPVIALEVRDRGTFFVELLPDLAPRTASNFLYLVRDGFFVRTYFHRRVENFVVQGGDPYTRSHPPDHEVVGTGGPEWSVPGEFSAAATHQRGTVGLARLPNDPNSGGSQFYICLTDQPSLDREYAIFARVIQGMEVVDALRVGDRIVSTKVAQGTEAENPADVGPLDLFRAR